MHGNVSRLNNSSEYVNEQEQTARHRRVGTVCQSAADGCCRQRSRELLPLRAAVGGERPAEPHERRNGRVGEADEGQLQAPPRPLAHVQRRQHEVAADDPAVARDADGAEKPASSEFGGPTITRRGRWLPVVGGGGRGACCCL